MPKAQFTGNIDGDRIVDGSIKGEDLAPDLALSTTGTINANKITVSTTTDVSGGTFTTSTPQKTAIVNNGKGVLTKSDVGLNNVDNTSDLNKPISTASSVAINEKNTAVITETAGTSLYLGDMVCRMSDGTVGVTGRDFEYSSLSSHAVLYSGKVFLLDTKRVSRRKSLVLYRKDTDDKLYFRCILTNDDREGTGIGKSTVTMGSEVLVDNATSKHAKFALDPNNLNRGVIVYNNGGNNNYMTAKTFTVDTSDTGTTVTVHSTATALNSAESDTFDVAFVTKTTGTVNNNTVDFKGHFLVSYRKTVSSTSSYELQLVKVNGSGASDGINTSNVDSTQIMANSAVEWEGVKIAAFPNNSMYFGILWNHTSSTTFTADDGGHSNNPSANDFMFCTVQIVNNQQSAFGLYTFNQVNGNVGFANPQPPGTSSIGNYGLGSYAIAANPIWDGGVGGGSNWGSTSDIEKSAKFLLVFHTLNFDSGDYEIWTSGMNIKADLQSDGHEMVQASNLERVMTAQSTCSPPIIDWNPYVSNRFTITASKGDVSYYLLGKMNNDNTSVVITWDFAGQTTAGGSSPNYTWHQGNYLDRSEGSPGNSGYEIQSYYAHWVSDDIFIHIHINNNNTSSLGKLYARLGNIGQVNLTNLNQFVGFVYDDPTSKTIYHIGETVPIQIAGHVKNLSASVTMNYFGTTSTIAKVRQMNMLDVSVTNEPLGDWYLGYTIGSDGIFLYYVNDHSTAYLT